MNAPRRNHGFTDEQLHRMCRRKMRYADEMGATAGAMCSLDRRPEVRRLWVYPCPACKGWHLTKYRVAGRRPAPLAAGCVAAEERRGDAIKEVHTVCDALQDVARFADAEKVPRQFLRQFPNCGSKRTTHIFF